MFKLLTSLGHALRGLAFLVKSERNARIHAAATVLIIALAAMLRIDGDGWCWLIVAIALVWIAEALNTAVERLADRVSLEQHPLTGQAKDLAAGATLIAAIAASVIGFIVLGPPLWHWLRR